MQRLTQKLLGDCGSCGVSVMALSVAGGGRNPATCLFIYIDPALQIAEGIAAELEIVLRDSGGGEGSALAAAGGRLLAGWLRRRLRLRASSGFERRALFGCREVGRIGRSGKPGIGFEERAMIGGGRFRELGNVGTARRGFELSAMIGIGRFRPKGNLGKPWMGSPGLPGPCRR